MPRFVLLRHECPRDYVKPSHWDLMLEQEGTLKTWELQELPASWARLLDASQTFPTETVPAICLPDHRIAYLDYQGPLSDDRGEVRQCASGTYEILSQQNNLLWIRLSGATLGGELKLSHTGGEWRLEVHSSTQ